VCYTYYNKPEGTTKGRQMTRTELLDSNPEIKLELEAMRNEITWDRDLIEKIEEVVMTTLERGYSNKDIVNYIKSNY
jgi:hypothetical protein